MLEWIKRLLWRSEYRYERPLSELISLALDTKTLDQLVTNINKGRPISQIKPRSTSGIPYIEKILSEEVEKQFTEEHRPFIELILNGIDAKPKDYEGEYVVKVDVSPNSFSVDDSGKSMGLRDILQTFIIPFSTDKDKLEDIGRFGVGFFSNLIYCLERPNKAKLVVETNDGQNPYKLTFWSTSDSVDGLQVKVEKGSKKKQGTKVEVRGYQIEGLGLRDYISDYMKYFDLKRAVIKLGWSTVNELPPGVTYWGSENFSSEQGVVEQTVRITANPKAFWRNEKLRMYSQGVFILEKDLRTGELRIDLPSAIEVVEGRDEFKTDENYHKSVRKAYDLLVEFARKYAVKDGELQASLRDMVPYVEDQLEIPFGRERTQALRESIFPERAYLLENDDWMGYKGDYNNALRFFGKDILSLVYKPKSYLTLKFWQGHFPGLGQLVQDETEILTEGDLDSVKRFAEENGMPFHNTTVLPRHHRYRLVNLKTGKGGFSPFVYANGIVYVRANDDFFSRPEDFASAYGIFTTLQKAMGLDENKIEDMILAR